MKNKNLIIRFLILILLTIIGIILLVWGANDSNTAYISVGASLACVGISLFIDSLLTKDVADILKEYTRSHFLSEEEKIAPFRRKYYCYWLTQSKTVSHWRHAIYDFSKNHTPGRLTAEIIVIADSDKKTQKYFCEAVFRGDKLLFVLSPVVGREPNVVGIIPEFGYDYASTHYGIGHFKTFDGNDVISSFILSEKPFEDWTKIGQVSDKDTEDEMWNKWSAKVKYLDYK
jgi:hypothetical protein